MSKTIKTRLKHLNNFVDEQWDNYYWQFLVKHETNIDWERVSSNENITLKKIVNNGLHNWDWNWNSSNPNINMEYVKNNFNRDWNWSILSLNKNITIQDIENNGFRSSLLSVEPFPFYNRATGFTSVNYDYFVKNKDYEIVERQ